MILLAALLIRVIYVKIFSRDPYTVLNDSWEYEGLGRQFLQGDFSGRMLDRFIMAPLYPFILSVMMLLSQAHWLSIVIWLQIIVGSMSCVVLYQLTRLWFRDERIAVLAAALYMTNPFMFWYTSSLGTECFFTSLLLGFLYCLEEALTRKSMPLFLLSAFLFGLDYLLKSPILLLSPFLAYYMVIRLKAQGVGLGVSWRYVAVFALLSFSLSLPYGIYHHRRGDGYVLSSNGGPYLLLLGNSNFGYLFVDKQDAATMKDMRLAAWCSYDPEACPYNDLPQREKQKMFVRYSLKWVFENPGKALRLKVFQFWSLLRPGVNSDFYPRSKVWASRIIWTPLYVLCVLGFLFKGDRMFRNIFIYLFCVMALFYVVLAQQARFRSIILEPFVVIYASAGALWLADRLGLYRRSNGQTDAAVI